MFISGYILFKTAAARAVNIFAEAMPARPQAVRLNQSNRYLQFMFLIHGTRFRKYEHQLYQAMRLSAKSGNKSLKNNKNNQKGKSRPR